MSIVFDRIIVDDGFLHFANAKTAANIGIYVNNPAEKARAFRAMEIVKLSESIIELDSDHGFWLIGPLGNMWVSDPLDLAKKLEIE